jgi:hypothetical protein
MAGGARLIIGVDTTVGIFFRLVGVPEMATHYNHLVRKVKYIFLGYETYTFFQDK